MAHASVADSYASCLANYLADPDESTLAKAYEIGRRSIQEGAGACELVSAHNRALLPFLPSDTIAPLRARATAFLMECLAPLEMAYRGFIATNESVRTLNVRLQQTNADLMESSAEIDQFAYLAAHDLSEPLRAIAGPLQLLSRRYEGHLDADADDFIGFAVRACEQMRELLDDLVAYTDVGNRQTSTCAVDCNAAAASALEHLQDSIRATGALVTVDWLPMVEAEAGQLFRIFCSLISNALKFVAPGVHPEVHIAAEQVGDRWRISVLDNGIGVDPEYRARIFGMAKRLHGHDGYAGSGMGLALVKKLVLRNRGSVGVDDSPNATGSRFWFTLPIVTRPDAVVPAMSPVAAQPHHPAAIASEFTSLRARPRN